MTEAKIACLRCGNFVVDGEAPVVGVALCASCLAWVVPEKDRDYVYPPRSIVWWRIRPFTASGFAFGLFGIYALFAVNDSLPVRPVDAALLLALASFMGVCFAVLGELTGLGLVFVAMPFHSMTAWRRILQVKLGLPRETDAFSLASLSRHAVKLRDVRMPVEVGLLAVGAGGLAFLGDRGTRLALASGTIVKTGRRVMRSLPPRLAAALTLEDGSEVFIIPLESRSPFESARLVRELGDRLR